MFFPALLMTCALAAPASKAAPDPATEAVLDALASSTDPLEQARALCRLAWPRTGPRNAAISARARKEIERFSPRYMFALQETINNTPVAYSDEIVQVVMIQQQQANPADMPELVPTLIDAVWVGNAAAKERAIRALLVLDRPPLAVQPMIDAAIEDPSLAPLVVESLGRMRYEQARFWLEKMMFEGPVALRPSAASSLAQIGGAALGPLKNGLKAPDRETRVLAARALLPAATEFELGAMYEYIEKHGDDDPGLTKSMQATAANFEKAIAARDAAEAAAAPKDF